jgi:toxin ParE1/3/4
MRVRWTRVALRHLDQIQDYVAEESRLEAYRLVAELTERPERLLAQHPHAGRLGRIDGTRELVFADLPYIVVYRVTTDVEIVGVVHTARQWPKKL